MTLLLRHWNVGYHYVHRHIKFDCIQTKRSFRSFHHVISVIHGIVFRIFYFVMTRMNVIYQWQIWQRFFDWNFVTLVRFWGRRKINQCHKSHNAPIPYPIVHHSKQKCVHTLWDMGQVRYGICKISLLLSFPGQYSSRESDDDGDVKNSETIGNTGARNGCGVKLILKPWHVNACRITGPLWRESTGNRWIP